MAAILADARAAAYARHAADAAIGMGLLMYAAAKWRRRETAALIELLEDSAEEPRS
jgi:hypothetical protein